MKAMRFSKFKFFFGLLLLWIVIPFHAKAQFYDSDNEVRIYILDAWLNNPNSQQLTALVFNFNGQKGAIVAKNGNAPGHLPYHQNVDGILEDDSHLEKFIYSNPDVILYNSKESSSSRVCYHVFRTSTDPFTYQQLFFEEKYFFSYDGSKIIELSGSAFGNSKKGDTYSRVTKEELVELLLARQNRSSKQWR